jgi:hypothetical protein
MTTVVMTRAPRDETGDECIVFAEGCRRLPKGIDSLADVLFAAQSRSVTQFNDQQGEQKLSPPTPHGRPFFLNIPARIDRARHGLGVRKWSGESSDDALRVTS